MSRIRSAAIAIAIALTTTTTRAQTADYNATADITVTVADLRDASGASLGAIPIGLSIIGETFVLDDFTDVFGDASAGTDFGLSPMFDMALGIDEGTTQITDAFGSAGPGDGFAESIMYTDGFIEIINETSDAITVVFDVSFALTATATADDPATQFSEAFAGVAIDILTPFSVAEDTILEEFVFAFSDDVTSESLSDSFSFEVTVVSDAFADIFIIADSDGFADSLPEIVPAPAALPAGIALMGLLGLKRKQRNA